LRNTGPKTLVVVVHQLREQNKSDPGNPVTTGIQSGYHRDTVMAGTENMSEVAAGK
jgi:hypothetical protein